MIARAPLLHRCALRRRWLSRSRSVAQHRLVRHFHMTCQILTDQPSENLVTCFAPGAVRSAILLWATCPLPLNAEAYADKRTTSHYDYSKKSAVYPFPSV
ncbi:hypothetical protein SMDB11_2340 [Serratia marcescens subsp. marcescens Db11]|uniref:Uncharacterized protein n=1 Tax=Serratia marcescens subsp. marcescens Db11 TaxID=273526 RepID=A0ABC9IJH0_SERMA|nr:hypothetical protein SMDB11_2340 [Serratia marcescens subsp. marcescens Db11]